MTKSDELRFGLDYNISKDFLNSPGDPPPRLRRQGSLSLYLQYHTRRKNGIGCFARITKINAVLLLRALKRRKAWSIALVLEMDFAQEEGAQGKKIQEEGGEVMLQASFLTSRVGLKLHNKSHYPPSPARQTRRCRNRFSNYGSSPEELHHALLPAGRDAELGVRRNCNVPLRVAFMRREAFWHVIQCQKPFYP